MRANGRRASKVRPASDPDRGPHVHQHRGQRAHLGRVGSRVHVAEEDRRHLRARAAAQQVDDVGGLVAPLARDRFCRWVTATRTVVPPTSTTASTSPRASRRGSPGSRTACHERTGWADSSAFP